MIDHGGLCPSYKYIHMQGSSMQGIYDRLSKGVHLPPLFIYMQCNGMQGIYDQLTRGVHLPSIYMHCTRSSSGCSGMQGLCA